MSGEKRHPRETCVEMTELVLPNDTNVLGNLLGGRLMHWIDITGALAAQKHARRPVATAVVDSLDFRHPVRMGEVVTLRGQVTWAGHTSMEVRVEAFAENMRTGNIIQVSEAFLTFVALDEQGRPAPVPELEPETEEERLEMARAVERRALRLARVGRR